jgi:uncharacterized protein HemX
MLLILIILVVGILVALPVGLGFILFVNTMQNYYQGELTRQHVEKGTMASVFATQQMGKAILNDNEQKHQEMRQLNEQQESARNRQMMENAQQQQPLTHEPEPEGAFVTIVRSVAKMAFGVMGTFVSHIHKLFWEIWEWDVH